MMRERAVATGRDEAVHRIQRELIAFARRARGRAVALHPDLSLAAFSLLDLMNERGGCRSADLAAHFVLDKSTVSRQVAALEQAGYLVREPDPADSRGRILRPSAAGLEAARRADEERRRAVAGRFAEWDEADVIAFARYLERYNAVD